MRDFSTLKLGTHNINSLKVNSHKLDMLLDQMREENIDIIGISETNISERQGKFLIPKDSDYIGFWAKANENKIKGSGVRLVIRRNWEKHIEQIDRFRNYYISYCYYSKRLS